MERRIDLIFRAVGYDEVIRRYLEVEAASALSKQYEVVSQQE